MENELKVITATWYEVGVKINRIKDDGSEKIVPELYVVDGATFGDSENRVCEEIAPYANGEFKVNKCKLASFSDIIFASINDARYYKAKIAFSADNGKEERMNLLVSGIDFYDAAENVKCYMNCSIVDWRLISLYETKIVDVINRKEAAS